MQALLIDSSIYIFRSYFTLPEKWHAQDNGYPTQAVYGFTQFLLDLLKTQSPQFIFCAFDESLKTGFRHRLSVNYKANRELPDPALAFQLNACRQMCRTLGIREMASTDFEADDLIASVATKIRASDVQPVVVSRDKDLMQIIKAHDLYWDFGQSTVKNQAQLEEKLSIRCEQMADYLALVGDNSDSISGVPGIGAKTAIQLLEHFSSIDEIIANAGQIGSLPIRGAVKIGAKVAEYSEQIKLSRQLASIVETIDTVPSCNEISWKGIHNNGFTLLCEEMGFADSFTYRANQLKQRSLNAYTKQTTGC